MNVSLRSKHQAPKREAFGCRDAPLRFIRGRRSRGLASGWQTKGADIHSSQLWSLGDRPLPLISSNLISGEARFVWRAKRVIIVSNSDAFNHRNNALPTTPNILGTYAGNL